MRAPIASQVASVVNCHSRTSAVMLTNQTRRAAATTLGHSWTVRRSSSLLGDRQWANDSLPDADPCDGPSVGLPSTFAGHCTRRDSSCFAGPSSRSHLAAAGPGRPTVSVCEGERRPLRPEVVPQHPVGVGPCSGVAPPRWSGHQDRAVSGAQRRQTIRERDTDGTASSFGDVPSHTPHAVPGSSQSCQRNQRLPRSPWVGLRVDSRGGSDAPCGRKPRRKPGRRLSPAGRRSPLAAIRSWRMNLRDCIEPTGARGTSAHAADCDCARSHPRSYGRARPRQGFARCARRGLVGLPRP